MPCTAPPPQYFWPTRQHPAVAAGLPPPDQEKVLPAIHCVPARAPLGTAADISPAPDRIPSPDGTNCWRTQTELQIWCVLLRPLRSSILARPAQLPPGGFADRSRNV